MKKIVVILSIGIFLMSACSNGADSCADAGQTVSTETLENEQNVSIELSESATDELKNMVEGAADSRMFRIQAAKG